MSEDFGRAEAVKTKKATFGFSFVLGYGSAYHLMSGLAPTPLIYWLRFASLVFAALAAIAYWRSERHTFVAAALAIGLLLTAFLCDPDAWSNSNARPLVETMIRKLEQRFLLNLADNDIHRL